MSSIAQASQTPEAQSQLVTELKAALQRALALPESSEKHVRVQAMTSLINVVIESVVSTNRWNMRNEAATAEHNIIKLMVRKGLANDLARVPHSLDLSSPNMAMTINYTLHPLETLARMVNQPTTVTSSSAKKTSKPPTASTAPPTEASTAQGDVHITDVSHEQHDETTDETLAETVVEPQEEVTNSHPRKLICAETFVTSTASFFAGRSWVGCGHSRDVG